MSSGVRDRVRSLREAVFRGRGLPDRPSLPRYVAPLPAALENIGLALAWVVVAINVAGTGFGFWYYGFHPVPLSDPLITWQFAAEPPVMWPFVPDSPVATLLIASSLTTWKLGYADRFEWLHALAFFGCIKLGAWTPYTLLLFQDGFADLHVLMYNFLFWSHLAMVVEAFLVYRYSDFPPLAVLVAVVWYGFNDLVDYFVPIVGTPHHTLLPGETTVVDGVITHSYPGHLYAAAGAVVLTLAATYLALSTRIELLSTEGSRPG
jgi:uncharacterized membrane protein YpjA